MANPRFTPVVFRTDDTGEVVAVFPTIPNDVCDRFMTCYVHVGQHSGCSHEWYLRSSRPADLSEYADLKRELESIGYQLRVSRRIAASHHRVRQAALRQVSNG